MSRSVFLLSCLLLLSGFVEAQNRWTLQQCVQYALDHNLQVRQYELNVDQSKADQDQAYASFLPNLNGQIGHSYFRGRFIDPYTNIYTDQDVQSTNVGVNATVQVFQGLQLQHLLNQSRLTYMASRKDLEKIRNDISLNVVAAYLQVLYNEDLLVVLQSQLEATQDQYRRMKRMYELGSASKGNFLDIDAQLASDSASWVNGKAQVDQSMLTLTQLLEIDTLSGFAVVHPDVATELVLDPSLSTEKVYQVALQTQPDVEAGQLRVRAAEKSLSAARAARYPRLLLSGNWNTNFSTSNQKVTGYTFGTPYIYPSGFTSTGDSVFTVDPNLNPTLQQVPFWEQLQNNRGSGVGFTLQLPFLNGWSVNSNISRSRIALEQSRINDRLVRNNLYKSVQQAVLDAYNAHHNLEAANRRSSSLKEASDFSRQRFELGLINTYEYALASNNYSRAQADLIRYRYEYLFRIKVIDFYEGKPLTF